MRRLNMPIGGARIAIQGFGNVGSTTSELFAKAGALIVAAQDFWRLDLQRPRVADCRTRRPCPASPHCRRLSRRRQSGPGGFLGCALRRYDPRGARGANNCRRAPSGYAPAWCSKAPMARPFRRPTIFSVRRGIVVVPDVICNSGGVTVSYFEWVQDFAELSSGPRTRSIMRLEIVLDALDRFGTPRNDAGFSLRTPHSWSPASASSRPTKNAASTLDGAPLTLSPLRPFGFRINFISRRVEKRLDTHLPLSLYKGAGLTRASTPVQNHDANGPLRADIRCRRGWTISTKTSTKRSMAKSRSSRAIIEWRRESNNRVMRGV